MEQLGAKFKECADQQAGGEAAAAAGANAGAAAGAGAEQMGAELIKYLEQIDPSIREQFKQNIDSFKA